MPDKYSTLKPPPQREDFAMSASDTKKLEEQISNLEDEILKKKEELSALRKTMPSQEVSDYVFKTAKGESKLSELFGAHDELIIIHNMGKGCNYCTLWADGFNGIVDHLENRAGLALVSPDDTETQKALAESRGWKFKMLSGKGNTFTGDMGFLSAKGGNMPGFSTFIRDNSGKMQRVAHAFFGPGDDYCSLWHLFELLGKGVNDWEPKPKY
jgi:predicted dithiol-disulfide oxidoreductase (DUF899 family)